MNIVTELLRSIQREHVLAALTRLDQGHKTAFSTSKKYDLIYKGKRYAPKEVAGLALEEMTGQIYGPSSLRGGEDTACFNALKRCDFILVPKMPQSGTNIKADVASVLALQLKYSSRNTEEMLRRGHLIRWEIPALIWDHIELLDPIFRASGYECAILGSDGVGPKNYSPWIRIYDPEMSPSATKGWYVVLHFSFKGDMFYATLGCGATKFKDGSLYDLPDIDLKNQVAWAKGIAREANLYQGRFDDQVKLYGNGLSDQFEKAIAFAKAYRPETLDEGEFWQDLQDLCRLLIVIYDYERQGREPIAVNPTDLIEQEIQNIISPERKSSRGQGRGLSYPERVAVEKRAMEVAKAELLRAGYADIKDVSSNKSYDFSALKDGVEWYIEVKGTTSRSADTFMLTAPELKLHRSNPGQTILALVSGINLQKEEVVATGGSLELIAPWDMNGWDFQPIAYRANRN